MGIAEGASEKPRRFGLRSYPMHAIISFMRKTIKYRLYPTTRQAHMLEETLDTCRQVYNQTLAHRKEAWEQRQTTLSLYETNTMLTQWKRERPGLSQGKPGLAECPGAG